MAVLGVVEVKRPVVVLPLECPDAELPLGLLREPLVADLFFRQLRGERHEAHRPLEISDLPVEPVESLLDLRGPRVLVWAPLRHAQLPKDALADEVTMVGVLVVVGRHRRGQLDPVAECLLLGRRLDERPLDPSRHDTLPSTIPTLRNAPLPCAS